jgi:hypothetical protein
VLGEEMPIVITEALDEQHEWNRHQVLGKRPRQQTADNEAAVDDAVPPWVFTPPQTSGDPFVSLLTSTERALTAMALLLASDGTAPRPRETLLGRFFRDRYKVGTETLTRDLPQSVLLELLATAPRTELAPPGLPRPDDPDASILENG